MERLIALLLALFAASLAGCAGHSIADHQHRFTDAERWARVFDDPARDAWQKPAEVIAALQLAPQAVVADIGAGTGYFASRLARAVPGGRVYALDAEPDMVRYLGERARREGLANLTPLRASGSDTGIPTPVDVALMVDVYHHIDNRVAYFGRLRDALKPDGRLAIVDFTMQTRRGPPPRARVAPEQVKSELAAAGYALIAEHGFLPDQYFLVFRPVRP